MVTAGLNLRRMAVFSRDIYINGKAPLSEAFRKWIIVLDSVPGLGPAGFPIPG